MRQPPAPSRPHPGGPKQDLAHKKGVEGLIASMKGNFLLLLLTLLLSGSEVFSYSRQTRRWSSTLGLFMKSAKQDPRGGSANTRGGGGKPSYASAELADVGWGPGG